LFYLHSADLFCSESKASATNVSCSESKASATGDSHLNRW